MTGAVRAGREVVTEADIRAAGAGALLEIGADALLTPTAEELACRLGVRLRRRATAARTVALANWLPACPRAARLELAQVFAAGAPGGRGAGDPAAVVVVPFPLLAAAGRSAAGSGLAVAAPDVAAERAGAFTGEVSAPMAADAGATWALLNHRDGGTPHRPADKVRQALAAGLTPVVCLGEDPQAPGAGFGLGDVRRARRELLDGLDAAALRRVHLVYQTAPAGAGRPGGGAGASVDELRTRAAGLADGAPDGAPRPGVAVCAAALPAAGVRELVLALRRGTLGALVLDGPQLAPLLEAFRGPA
ncbi:MAG: triose-phosphate isomerase [Planctomycetes bacterium]|nr:triose-phosphate isomerase [Planctomycetota bacterium]